ncbi:MAG: VWA domain-containing protein [Schaedlerella sp.]|nr:VWA domain-containing protein [Schaedlerella sp.]
MKKDRKKQKFKMRFLTKLMLTAILAVCICSGIYFYTIFNEGSALKETDKENSIDAEDLEAQRQQAEERLEETENSGIIDYVPSQEEKKDLDWVITDKNDAYELLQEIQYDLGISDAEEEYRPSYVRENGDYTVYTMQQYYNGVEIYGSELKMTTDASGHLQAVNGKYQSLSGVSIEANLSEKDAYEYVEKYLKSEYQYNLNEVYIEGIGKKICILDNSKSVLSYVFELRDTMSGEAYQTIVVDANTGEIVSDNSQIYTEMIPLQNVQGQSERKSLEVWRSSDTDYALRDDDRNILVGEAASTNISKNASFTEIRWNPETESPNESGVDALANLQTIYDYFLNTYGRQGTRNDGSSTDLRVYVNVERWNGHSFVDNAAMVGTDLICIGQRSNSSQNEYSEDVNVVTHEYVHGVTNGDSTLLKGTYSSYSAQNSTQFGIGEALADIFAELTEDYMDDHQYNNSCNWRVGNDGLRDLANPSNSVEGGTHLTNENNYTEGTVNCHLSSTIISHAAYLMTEGLGGEGVDTETLGTIWYHSMAEMTSSTDFRDVRKLIESKAVSMNNSGDSDMNNENLECIIDAFDRTGVMHSYNYALTPESDIQVYDQNNELYDYYNITVNKRGGEEILSEDVEETSYHLELDPGIYEVQLTDLEDEELYITFSLIVNDNDAEDHVEDYKETERFFTEFGSDERQVALVLDVSGSMDGTPIDETRDAAVKFVETVLDESPNSKISIVTYAEDAKTVIESSSESRELKAAINGLGTGGGTNMYDAMDIAKDVLDRKKADKKLLFVMSDGLPNRGQEDGGDYNTPIIELADEMKSEEVIIYSLGFFHNLTGGELESGQTLMEAIASGGYDYNVSNTEDVQFVFSGIAYDVSGDSHILIRIECPVDVIVQHKGERLSSVPEERNISTSFGLLSFDGENDEEKILRLKEGEDYEICIKGTGIGTMDYSISYPDEKGEYTDERSFNNIPITKDTVIVTSTQKSRITRLEQDTDGNGTFDQNYAALKGGKVCDLNKILQITALIITGILMFILVIFKVKRKVADSKGAKFCPSCGTPINGKIQFCGTCGRNLNEEAKKKPSVAKASRGLNIFKLVIIGICLFMCIGITCLRKSAPVTVAEQIKNNRMISAQIICDEYVRGEKFSEKYLSLLLSPYMNQVMDAYDKGEISEATVKEIYQMIENLDVKNASETAQDYINSLWGEEDTEQ